MLLESFFTKKERFNSHQICGTDSLLAGSIFELDACPVNVIYSECNFIIGYVFGFTVRLSKFLP